MWRVCVSLLAALGCTQASGEPSESGRTKYHMRQHFNDLRTIERMLVSGKLDDAKLLAYMIAKPSSAMPHGSEAAEVVTAAGGLSNARTLEEAAYAEVRVATACAQCHLATMSGPVFRTPSKAPADRPTVPAQMARHQWAVDRLWEGIVGGSDEHWRAGLYVLATSSLQSFESGSPAIAKHLQRLARIALDRRPKLTLVQRQDIYAELLITCAGCHSSRAAL